MAYRIETLTGEYVDETASPDFYKGCDLWSEAERIGVSCRLLDVEGVKVMGGYEAVDVTARACVTILKNYKPGWQFHEIPQWLSDAVDRLAE